MKISHCEFTQDSLILITHEGVRLTLDRDEAIQLGFGLVKYAKQNCVDFSFIFQDGFNWSLAKSPPPDIPVVRYGCRTCEPTKWKPKKPGV